MKTVLSALTIFLLTFLTASAQETAWLFQKFSKAEIEFRNHSKNRAEINFDVVSQRLCFLQNGTIMEVTNSSAIRSIIFSDRIFVMKDNLLCEVIPSDGDTIYVNWSMKNANIGSKGVFGLPTQGSVQVLSGLELDGRYSVTNLGKYKNQDIYSKDIWTQKNDNTYFFRVGGREYKAKYLSTLYELFPERKTELKKYAKENKLNMSSAENAFKLIGFLRMVSNQ